MKTLGTIHTFLANHNITQYKILEDGSVDVFQDVVIYDSFMRILPVAFNHVHGNFTCSGHVLLKTFQNYPKIIEGTLNCTNNRHNTFRFSPQIIKGNLICDHNNIRTFKRFPEYVGGNVSCNFNQLASFEFAPKTINGDFKFAHNKFKSLEHFPENVKGKIFCGDKNSLQVFYTHHHRSLTLDQKAIFSKYHSYFEVWNPDFNIFGFDDLIKEIKEGLL